MLLALAPLVSSANDTLVSIAEAESALERPWMDATLCPDRRVQLLLGAMTLEEKVAQLGYKLGECDDPSTIVKAHPLGVGGCGVGAATGGANRTNALRAAVLNGTRLGIPPSVYGESTHSGGSGGTTVFPMPCSQGASWNLSLVEAIGASNALQLRAAGGSQGLSPILQVCTDPRFGRMEENFGEDPLHVSACGRAALAGLQGRDGGGGASTYLGDSRTRVASQAKHFAMYGAGPKDGYTPFGGGPNERTLFETYLRPWRDYAQAGGRGVMASHNMIDWVPVHGSRRMLTDVLREQFGFAGGYIGSDNTNVEGLSSYFAGFADNASDAASPSPRASTRTCRAARICSTSCPSCRRASSPRPTSTAPQPTCKEVCDAHLR